MSDPDADARREQVRAVIREKMQSGDATAWFDELYRHADGDPGMVPWARLSPRPQLEAFLAEHGPHAGRALVVGCGLGDAAEAIAAAGYDTRAFDIADTAVAWCKKRFPESAVDYRQGDLLQLPEDWRAELVYECFTVQALPLAMRREVMEAVARLVAPGGRLFVVTLLRPSDDPPEGPPWPLSRREVDDFLALGLEEVSRVEEMGETVVTAAITYARRA